MALCAIFYYWYNFKNVKNTHGGVLLLVRYHFNKVIWYYLYNFKNLKNIHGRALLLLKFQAEACNFTKNNTRPWIFFRFLKLYKWYKIAQSITYVCKRSARYIYFFTSEVHADEQILEFGQPRITQKQTIYSLPYQLGANAPIFR